MAVGVLVAVGAAPFESAVLGAAATAGLHVVRRCVDVADLLATAATRQAGVALVSPALAGIDTEVVGRLAEEQVAVVGVVAAEPSAESSADAAALRRLGIDVVVTADRLDGLGDAVAATLERDAATGLEEPPADEAAAAPPTAGRVLAVWGPTGAPGRSVVALGIAASLAKARVSTMVIDADVYGGSQAQLLGLLDESSGLLAAARSANRGSLDARRLAEHAREIAPCLRVLTGLPRSDRWVELAPVLLRRVVDAARTLDQVTVLDCAFNLELDEEISYDTAAPRRNGATLTALELADRVVVVGAADPIGLGRLLRALSDLSERVPGVCSAVVVNRMRPSLGWSADDVADLVRRTSQLDVAAFLPDDPAACDRALVQGRSLAESVPQSRLARALDRLAASLAVDLDVLPAGQRNRRRVRRLG